MILGRRIPFLLPIAPPMLAFVLAGAAMGIGAAA
jgi:hypothetical protein